MMKDYNVVTTTLTDIHFAGVGTATKRDIKRIKKNTVG